MGTKCQHATSRPPKPLAWRLSTLMSAFHCDTMFCVTVKLPPQVHQPLFFCFQHVAYCLHRLRYAVSKCYRDDNAQNLDSEFKDNHGLNCGPRWRSRYNDSLRDRRSVDRIPVGARFSHPASYTMGTGTFPQVKRAARDVGHPPPS